MNETSQLIPIEKLQAQALNLFDQNEQFDWNKLSKTPYYKKILNERKINKYTEELIRKIEFLQPIDINNIKDFDLNDPKILKLKAHILDFLKKMDEDKVLFDQPFLTFFIEAGYLDVAIDFLKQAQKEDSDLSNQEIFQALRNVWIMNSLQLFWNKSVKLTPSIYSYSMLYPYTDNYLDDPSINPIDKIQFNYRIENALSGNHLSPNIKEEQRITNLIKNIEQQYSRNEFPKIYESIQLIHNAQVTSMQQGHKKKLDDREILKLSFYKGGTSVLTDGYLVKPDISLNEAAFSYKYGTFLQLLDDVQDIEEDMKLNCSTYFNATDDVIEREKRLENLISYIYKVNIVQTTDTPNAKLMKKVIRECTLLMLMEAMGSNRSIVSRAFYNKMESYSKVRLSFYVEMKHKLHTSLSKILNP